MERSRTSKVSFIEAQYLLLMLCQFTPRKLHLPSIGAENACCNSMVMMNFVHMLLYTVVSGNEKTRLKGCYKLFADTIVAALDERECLALGQAYVLSLSRSSDPNDTLLFSLDSPAKRDSWKRAVELQIDMLNKKQGNPSFNLGIIAVRTTDGVIISASNIEGYATKRGHIWHTWKVRWFCMEDGVISYYKDKSKTDLRGTFSLHHDTQCITLSEAPSSDASHFQNILQLSRQASPDKELIFSLDSPRSMQLWLQEIVRYIQKVRRMQIYSSSMIDYTAPSAANGIH